MCMCVGEGRWGWWGAGEGGVVCSFLFIGLELDVIYSAGLLIFLPLSIKNDNFF